MIFCSFCSFGVSLTVPDPRVIWIAVPDDNSATGMVLLGDKRDVVDDWKVATPTRAVMGDDGFMEEAPNVRTSDIDDDDLEYTEDWYRAPPGAKCCDRLCFKREFAKKELEVWWASKDAAALRPRRQMRRGKRYTQELAEVNRKRAVWTQRGAKHQPHSLEGLLHAGVADYRGGDYRW